MAFVKWSAGWWWNSRIDVEGAEIRTLWQVDDEEGGHLYRASIRVLLPKTARAAVIEQGDNETVKIKRRRGLTCDASMFVSNQQKWDT